MAKKSLAKQIDGYLRGRGSPMAGLGETFVRAGVRYGVDPRMLVGIGVIESGGGLHLKNKNNFANWGVHLGKTYPNFNAAIMDLARGLNEGYISKGLKTPRQIVTRYAPGSDGNDEGGWANVVSSVMGEIGSGTGFSPRSPTRSPGPKTIPKTFDSSGMVTETERRKFGADALMQIVSGERKPMSALMGFKTALEQLTEMKEQAGVKPEGKPGKKGKPTNLSGSDSVVTIKPDYNSLGLGKIIGTPHAGTHNLGNWQSDNAYDVSMPVGTPIRADFDGTITGNVGPISGADQSGRYAGLRMTLSGKNNSAWYGHLSKILVKAGQKVRKGQIIGYSGSANGVPHLHIGFESLPKR